MRHVILAVVVFLVIAVASVAMGQALSPDDPQGTLEFVLRALGDRSWLALSGGATILLVWAIRRFASGWVPWFSTRIGGVVLVLGCGVLTVIGSALSDGTFGWKEVVDGIGTMLVASGGFSLGKNALQGQSVPLTGGQGT